MTVEELKKELEHYPDFYEVLVEVNGYQHRIDSRDVKRSVHRSSHGVPAVVVINPR